MERKTKHRILGICVIIGLVIILLPFLQTGKDAPTETTIVKAPPFPEQTLQAENTTPTSAEFIQPNETIANHPTSEQNIETTSDSNLNNISATNRPSVVDAVPKQEIVREVTGNNPVTAETNTNDVSALQINRPVINEMKEYEPPGWSDDKTNAKAANNKTMKQLSEASVNSDDENGLVNLKTQAYVIQIGSFKDKTNAIRLVNQLRAKGYRAFIQQVSTALGNSTRVFIGPEVKRSTARAIASRLEQDMHIQGIVISYKPLTL